MIHPAVAALLILCAPLQEPPPADAILKGRATLLRAAIKPYAAFLKADAAKGEILLRMETDSQEKAWPLDPDAEVRVHGSWGRLDELPAGERVWVWIRPDRQNKPKSVFLIADEISEQDIHQVPYALASVDPDKREIEVRRKLDGKKEESRTLKVPASIELPGKTGGTLYLQTAAGDVRRLVDAEGLEAIRRAQGERLAERWRKEGLPGSVAALHAQTGEAEVLLDHEAMRWGRSVKPGDRVKLLLAPAVEAVVTDARPWNEKTRLTLATFGKDLADLHPGARVRVSVKEPAADTLKAKIPPDAGRAREGAARAEWLLASTYCACSISGDGCTGMYYTLAACNGMTCGMPNRVRKFVSPLVEKGLADPEILERMEKEFGASIWKPHLLR